MEKNAVIQVKSFSDLDEGDAIEVITPGKFIVKENLYEVVYEESEISGMKGTTTTLKIEEDRFILERVGTTSFLKSPIPHIQLHTNFPKL